MVRPVLFATAACALFAGCAHAPPPVRALPPGPTPAEVIDYAIAQAQYRAAKASGNADVVAHAERTFWRASWNERLPLIAATATSGHPTLRSRAGAERVGQ